MNELKNLTLGIEEEYQIIDPKSRELTSFISEFLETGAMMFKDQVKPELLQSQIEIGSNVCKDISELEDDIKNIRYRLGKFVKESDKMIKTLITMTKKSFGCVGVINNNKKLIGIITDGDLRRNTNDNLFNLKAADLMTKKPTTGEKNMLVGAALNIMNNKKITSLFICEKNIPIGIIHIHDLLRLSS